MPHAREAVPARLRLAAGALSGLAAGAAVGALRAGLVPPGLGPLEVGRQGTGTLLWIVLSALPGALVALLAFTRARSRPPVLARSLLVGVLWWAAWSLTAAPLLGGAAPTWDATAVPGAFPDLVADVLVAGLAALAWIVVAGRLPVRVAGGDDDADLPRIVVLGGGFAGVAAVQRLERLARRRRRWDVTLVSAGNFLLFTPMLPEVAAGALQAQHISAPLRAACPRTRFVHAKAQSVDLAARRVRATAGERVLDIDYDHLVLALGSEPTYRGVEGLEEHSLPLKTLGDALAVREHVLDCLDRADTEGDPAERRRLLTITVVGGGFAGVETVAELRDLARTVLRYFPALEADDLRFVLVHGGESLLPEIGPGLGEYARDLLGMRGVEVCLGTRVAGARADALVLDAEREIATRTIVWTAGNQPARLVADLGLPTVRPGAISVGPDLRVTDSDCVWAAGDCAAVPDGAGGRHPPTAQHALREGRALADNLAAVLDGGSTRPFEFSTLGMLAALGHRSGVAEVHGRCFSGALAWALWRATYLTKLPGMEKRVRVALDWLLDVAFPRDIVLTQDPTRRVTEPPAPAVEGPGAEGAPR